MKHQGRHMHVREIIYLLNVFEMKSTCTTLKTNTPDIMDYFYAAIN